MNTTRRNANEIVKSATKKIPQDFVVVNSQVDKPLITSKFTIPLTTYNENSTSDSPTGRTQRDVVGEKALETLTILQWRCGALADLLQALIPQIEQLTNSIKRDAHKVK